MIDFMVKRARSESDHDSGDPAIEADDGSAVSPGEGPAMAGTPYGQPPQTARPARFVSVWIHGGLIAFLTVVVWAGIVMAGPDSNNIGAGLCGLALVLLSLPWIVLGYALLPSSIGDGAWVMFLVACAFGNVGLHALLLHRWYQRRGR